MSEPLPKVIKNLEALNYKPYKHGNPRMAAFLRVTHDVVHFPGILRPQLSLSLGELAGVGVSTLRQILEVNRYIGGSLEGADESEARALATHSDERVPKAGKVLYIVGSGSVEAMFSGTGGASETVLKAGSVTVFDATKPHRFLTSGRETCVRYSIPLGKAFYSVG